MTGTRFVLSCLALILIAALCAAASAAEPKEAAAEEAQETVRLTTSDGKTVTGLLSGKGDTALILCHGRGYKTGAASFKKESAALAKKGIRCLALSFRGYPADAPPWPRDGELDIRAAFDHLDKAGAKRIFVLGSSMGGFLALRALKHLETNPKFGGVIVVSAYNNAACKASKAPKLFVVAENDRGYYKKTVSCFRAAADPREIITYKTGGHGQSLFRAHGDGLLDKIAAFIQTHSAPKKDEEQKQSGE